MATNANANANANANELQLGCQGNTEILILCGSVVLLYRYVHYMHLYGGRGPSERPTTFVPLGSLSGTVPEPPKEQLFDDRTTVWIVGEAVLKI